MRSSLNLFCSKFYLKLILSMLGSFDEIRWF